MAPLDPELEPFGSVSERSGRDIQLVAPRRGAWYREAQFRVNQQLPDASRTPKRIVICADGTWNSPYRTSSGNPVPTNVWLLYQMVAERDGSGLPQLAYYHAGVGTGGRIDRIIGGITGRGLRKNVLACYTFLVGHYRPGDELYLFGFSRGAYTVRSLAGLIRNSGIVDPGKCPSAAARAAAAMEAWSLYRSRSQDSTPVAAKAVDFRFEHSHPDFRIKCIGVWDTVGALGIPINGPLGDYSRLRHGFHDVRLSSRVDRGFHAIAIDERRSPFMPTMWEQQPNAAQAGQVMEQVWFPGVHADVGGGYTWSDRGIANVTLRWMINRVCATCGIQFDRPALSALCDTEPARMAVHDSLTWFYRALAGGARVRVLDGGLGQCGRRDQGATTTEGVHPSARWCCTTFGSTPMPVVKAAYHPMNLTDYDARMQKGCEL